MDYLTLNKIKKFIAEYFNVETKELDTESRKQPIVIYRMIAIWFVKAYSDNNEKYIGFNFGNRHRTTVIHAVNEIDDMIDSSKTFRGLIFDLKEKVEEHLGISQTEEQTI